jgi:hypothetical protein
VGSAFGDALFRNLTFNGRPAVENGSAYHELAFAAQATSVTSIVDEILAREPTIVVLAGAASATVPIVTDIERRWRASTPRPTYLVAPGSTEPFADFVGASADRRRRLWAIQSLSNSMSNARFVVRYNHAHPDAPVTRQINPSSEYDAFYLVAYATFALRDQAVTGAALATSIEHLLPPGPALEVGPNDVSTAFTRLARGDRIDLVGAQSGLDFNVATGETPSDFVLLCAAVGRDGRAAHEDVESGVFYRAASRTVVGEPRCP